MQVIGVNVTGLIIKTTNNIVEAAMCVLKDKILNRTRTYNVPQLFHFLSNTLSSYYIDKILSVISGRYIGINKYAPQAKKWRI